MEILVILLIIAVFGSFISDTIVNIICVWQSYKRKKNYITGRRTKWGKLN